MAEPTIRFDLILRPIAPGPKSQAPATEYAPDGSGRDYSYEYDEIQEARRVVEPIVSRGDDDDARRQIFSRPAKPADWGKVLRLGLAVLSEESKDLRVAAWMTEALGHLRGFAGLRDGFSLLRRLAARYWPSAYPRPDGDDLEGRASAYQFLDDWRVLPLLIRGIPLTQPSPASSRAPRSILDYARTKENGRRIAAHPKDDRDDLIASIERDQRLPEDWGYAVAATPTPAFARAARDIGPCLIAFKAWERSSEHLFGPRGPSLSQIGEALVECAEQVASILSERPEGEAEAEALNLCLGRARGERRPMPEPVAEPPDDEPAEAESWAGDDEPGPEDDSDAPPRPAPSPEAARPPGQAEPAGPPTDSETAYRRVVEAAAFLREADPDDPVPYLLVRSLRLGELYSLDDGPSPDHLPGPPGDARRELRRGAADERWDDLVALAESTLAGPEGRGWLDGHRLAIRGLESSGRDRAARACRAILSAVLADFPDLPSLELDDGTAAAGAETRAWLVESFGPAPVDTPPAIPPEPAPGTEAVHSPAPGDRAEALLRSGRVEEALRDFGAGLDAAPGGRDRFLGTLRFAGLCVELGHDRLGVPLLEGLGARSDDLGLLAWEGRAFFAEAARLLKRSLLRLDDGATPEGLARARARLFALDPAAGLDGEGGPD